MSLPVLFFSNNFLSELVKLSVPYTGLCILYFAGVIFLEETYGDHIYKISGQMGTVFGLALAFFLGFRMNTAYDRWWEGRGIGRTSQKAFY